MVQKAKMNCLVTGGNGLLGSEFIKATNGTDYSRSNGCDIRDEKTFMAAIDGVDLVIHAATIKKGKSTRETVDVNLNGTKIVIDCCLRKKIPLKIVSSSEALRPSASSYASTKFLIEKMASETNDLIVDCYRIPTLVESKDNILHFWKSADPAAVYFYGDVPRHSFFIGTKEAVQFCLSEGAGKNEFLYPKVLAYNLATVAQTLFGKFERLDRQGDPHESLSEEYTTKNAPIASEYDIIRTLNI
jgi:hypothetical protein